MEGDLIPRTADQFPVRMPPGMRDRIKAAAAANYRSMNSEIVSTLERAFPAPEMTAGAIPVYRAAVHGQRSFAGTGNIDVPISGIAGPCFVVARSSDLTPPGFQPPVNGPADPGFWYTCLISNTLLTIRNFNTARTIYFSVFGNPILGD